MKIAVPAEIKNNEFRVAITPAGVHELVASGHEVYIQKVPAKAQASPTKTIQQLEHTSSQTRQPLGTPET